jgi:hypothetical protein
MTTATAEKSSLKAFLEEVHALIGTNLKGAEPAEIHLLLQAYQRGTSPEQTAEIYNKRHAAAIKRNDNVYMADVKDALRNHAFSVEQEVQVLSNRIAASVQAAGAVDGLLYFSHSAHELPRLGARLSIYREFLTLLHIVQESFDSAHLALVMARAEAVSRLVNLKEGGESGERAGAADALKKVIKILDNNL